MMKMLAFGFISTTAALSPPTTFEMLQTAPVVRASDRAPVILPSLWREDIAFGFGQGELAVVAMLRHFG